MFNQNPENFNITDFEFLEEQLEKRSQIVNASQKELLDIFNSTNAQTNDIKEQLNEHFQNFDWDKVSNTIAKLSFLIKLEQETKEKLNF